MLIFNSEESINVDCTYLKVPVQFIYNNSGGQCVGRVADLVELITIKLHCEILMCIFAGQLLVEWSNPLQWCC